MPFSFDDRNTDASNVIFFRFYFNFFDSCHLYVLEQRRKEIQPTKLIVPPGMAGTAHQLAAHNAAMMQHQNSLVASVNAAFAANQQVDHQQHAPVAWTPASAVMASRDDAYYQATGLGRPVPNPTRMKNEHPFGPPRESCSLPI